MQNYNKKLKSEAIKESRHREGIPVAIPDLSPQGRGLLRRWLPPRNDVIAGFLLLALLGSMVIYAPKARAGLVVKLPSSLGLATNLVGHWTFGGQDIYESGTVAAVVLTKIIRLYIITIANPPLAL